jgi:hypothetical protein
MCAPADMLAAALAPPIVEGEAGTPVTVVSLPARRAGLEFVEKLLTSAMVARCPVPGDR